MDNGQWTDLRCDGQWAMDRHALQWEIDGPVL